MTEFQESWLGEIEGDTYAAVAATYDIGDDLLANIEYQATSLGMITLCVEVSAYPELKEVIMGDIDFGHDIQAHVEYSPSEKVKVCFQQCSLSMEGLDTMAQAIRDINADLDDMETFLNDYGIMH